MKRFTIPCDFGNQKAPFHIYVGQPGIKWHPLYFQSMWLSEKRGGKIPEEVMESFGKLQTIADENKVSFEELCVYALGTAKENESKQPGQAASGQEAIDKNVIKPPIENQVRVLATAEELKHVFDADFNLLFIICRGRFSEIYHAILLVRADRTDFVNELVQEKRITIELLSQIGLVEYIGKGADIDPGINNNIAEKYKITIEQLNQNGVVEHLEKDADHDPRINKDVIQISRSDNGSSGKTFLSKKISSTKQVSAENTVCILLVSGENPDGAPIFTYVAVRADKLESFMQAQKKETFYPEDYGVIIESGEGKPSEEIRKKMETEYGFDHQEMVNIPNADKALEITNTLNSQAGNGEE